MSNFLNKLTGDQEKKRFNMTSLSAFSSFSVSPVCTHRHVVVLGAMKQETLTVKCEVESSPPAKSFLWTFNSSGEQTEFPTRLQTNEADSSVLSYTPSSDLDYGTISCRAKNAINVQTSPCLFQIVAASRPYPLQNCSLSKEAPDSLQVDCMESYDGGMPQGFLMELLEVPSLRLVRNISLLVSFITKSLLFCFLQPTFSLLRVVLSEYTSILLRGQPGTGNHLSYLAVCLQPQGTLGTDSHRWHPLERSGQVHDSNGQHNW